MKIENYEAILAVRQHSGWTEAACQTNQSPSTISKRVNKVEEELGAPIFVRGKGTQAALTEFGELMLPYIQKIVSLHNRVEAYAGSIHNESEVRITVGYPPLIGTLGEAEILARFKNDNPSVRIDHVLRDRNELLAMVQERRLDCAFVFLVGNEQVRNDMLDILLSFEIAHIPIMRRETISVGLSQDHPLAGQRAVAIAEICQSTFVFNDLSAHEDLTQGTLRFFFDQKAAWYDPIKIVRMDFINKDMVNSFVAAGGGVLPTACIPPDVSPGVRFLPVIDSRVSSSAIFIYPKYCSSPAVRSLIRYVRAYAAENGVIG